MPPEFYEGEKKRRHPLEELFNASGWDILSAIQQGHRARTDVKGKLAEYFLNRLIEGLLEQQQIDSFVWSDKTGEPDFVVEVRGATYRVECKNVRSGKEVFPDAYKVEWPAPYFLVQG